MIAKASGRKKKGASAKEKTAISSKLDPKLRLLIEKGQGEGFLTYEELNEALPDDSVSPKTHENRRVRTRIFLMRASPSIRRGALIVIKS